MGLWTCEGIKRQHIGKYRYIGYQTPTFVSVIACAWTYAILVLSTRVCVFFHLHAYTRAGTLTHTHTTHTKRTPHTHTHTHTHTERQWSTQETPQNVNQSVVEVCICLCPLRFCALRSYACLYVFRELQKDGESQNALTSWTYPPITGHEVEAVRPQCVKLLSTDAFMRGGMPGCRHVSQLLQC